ncbi:MAG: hypothetical protein WAO91_03900 [Candidatus Nitrosotenuis sp.]
MRFKKLSGFTLSTATKYCKNDITHMEPVISFVAMALVVGGLIGQGFEMKKIRASIRTDEQLSPKNVFADRRNYKWYAIIAAGFVLWYSASAKL